MNSENNYTKLLYRHVLHKLSNYQLKCVCIQSSSRIFDHQNLREKRINILVFCI